MLNSEIEFKKSGDQIGAWWEKDYPPFNDQLLGHIRKGEDGFYRFHPATGVVMHFKLLSILAEKVSDLNMEVG